MKAATRNLVTAIILAAIAVGATIAPIFLDTGAARWLLPAVGVIGGLIGWHLRDMATRWRVAKAVDKLQVTLAIAKAFRQRPGGAPSSPSKSAQIPTGTAPDTPGPSGTPTAPSSPAERTASTPPTPAPSSNGYSADPAHPNPST